MRVSPAPAELDGMASQACTWWNQGSRSTALLMRTHADAVLFANLPATNERYHFHADKTPSHVSASTREFVRLNKPNNEEMLAVPPSSPDLNMCVHILGKAIQHRFQPRYGTRVELRADVLRHNSPLDEIRRSICSYHRGCWWQALRGVSGTAKISMTPHAQTETVEAPKTRARLDMASESHLGENSHKARFQKSF